MRTFGLYAPGLMLSAFCATTASAFTQVDGGRIKSVYTVVAEPNDNVSNSATVMTALPGANRTINIPAGGDTIITTFTAECRLAEDGNHLGDWVQVEIRDNGTPILPTAAGVGGQNSPLSFCSRDNYESHSVQVVKRLAPGTHRIEVFWKVQLGPGSVNPLAAWLDDWALTILVAN